MPLMEANDYYHLMKSFLLGDRNMKPLPSGFFCIPFVTNRLDLLIRVIKDGWDTFSLERKCQIILAINQAITECKKSTQPEIISRIEKFKQTLAAHNAWKETLLGIKSEELQKLYYPIITYDPDSNHGYHTEYKNVPGRNTYSIITSCFKTNKRFLLETNTSEQHCLDAAYVTQSADQSLTFALGDGCGGHFGDKNQDYQVARAAYFTTKNAVRLLNSLETPETFDSAYKWLVQALAQEVRLKSASEGTTLVAGRAFLKNNQYCVKGFNIGDGMCIAWDPHTKSCLPIAPAIVTVSKISHKEATANFPNSYKEYEIHPFTVYLPQGSIILMFSDGIYDYLPCISCLKEYAPNESYRETLLDNQLIKQLFDEVPTDAEPEIYAQILYRHVIHKMEEVRLLKIQASTAAQDRRLQVEAEILRKEEITDREDKQAWKDLHKPLDDLLTDIDVQIGDDMLITAIRLLPAAAPLLQNTTPSHISTASHVAYPLASTAAAAASIENSSMTLRKH